MEQYVTLIDESRKANLSLSEYARRRIFGRRVIPRVPMSDVQTIACLKQIGGMLKQIWVEKVVDPVETQRLLNQVKLMLHEIQIGFSKKIN